MEIMEIIADGKKFYPLSSILREPCKGNGLAVYWTMEQSLFYLVGRDNPITRRVRTHRNYLKYVIVNGLHYYIDNACIIK